MASTVGTLIDPVPRTLWLLLRLWTSFFRVIAAVNFLCAHYRSSSWFVSPDLGLQHQLIRYSSSSTLAPRPAVFSSRPPRLLLRLTHIRFRSPSAVVSVPTQSVPCCKDTDTHTYVSSSARDSNLHWRASDADASQRGRECMVMYVIRAGALERRISDCSWEV